MAAAKLNGKQIASGVVDLIVIGAFYAAFLWYGDGVPLSVVFECFSSVFSRGHFPYPQKRTFGPFLLVLSCFRPFLSWAR